MSQFLSNKYLRYRGLGQAPARVIDSDLPCTRCSYNLRGLMNNGKCPECGTPINVPQPARFALLAEAPLADIRKLASGLWLGVACIPAAPVAILFASGLAVQAGRPPWSGVTVAVLFVSLMWLAAVWRMMPVLETPEAVKYGFTPGSRLRHVARWSQVGWPVAIVLIEVAPASVYTSMGVGVSILASLGGLIAIALMLSRMADWSCDEPAGRMLNITVWLLPSASAILLAGAFVTVVRMLGCLAIAMWLLSLATFGLALLSLAFSATWSWRHARERMAKEAELRARIVLRPPPPPPSDEPIQLAKPGDPKPQVGLVDGEDSKPLPALDDIVRDVYCRECGYNLRGLKAYGRCPECGERIASA